MLFISTLERPCLNYNTDRSVSEHIEPFRGLNAHNLVSFIGNLVHIGYLIQPYVPRFHADCSRLKKSKSMRLDGLLVGL